MLILLMVLIGGMVNGAWAVTYTYHVVNNSGSVAISYLVEHDANSEALDIPEPLRSPLITYESGAYTYYKELACSNVISTYDAVDSGNEIFVRYDYENHKSTTYDIDLSGGTIYRMQTKNGFYLMLRISNTTYTGAQKSLNSSYVDYYLWRFKGNDPYNIEVYNEAKEEALACSTVNDWYKDMDFTSSVNRFVLFRGQTDGGADEGYWYLVSPKVNNQSPSVYAQRYAYYAGASNDNGDKMRICANDKKYFTGASNGGTRYQSDRDYCRLTFTSVNTYTYHLIGRNGTEVLQYKAYIDDTSTAIGLNENLVSPYAKNYHYYDTAAEAQANNTSSDFTTYAGMAGTDIYVGYDYDDTAGLDLTGGTPYSFRASEGEGDYYLGFPTRSTNARPNYAYNGEDYQLFLLTGSDPYRIQLECKAYSGYHAASSWQGGNPVNDSGGGHTGTQLKLYDTMTETSYFSLVKDDKMLNFSYHTANSSRYVMYFGSTQWFNIYGGGSPIVFSSERQISGFCSSALPITLVSRVPKVNVTLSIVSIDKGSGGTVLYSPVITADKGGAVSMPAEYSSPLAKNYKFYTLDQFNVSDGKYTLKGDAVEATTFPTEDAQTLYVKYEYDEDNSVTFGSNTLHVDLTGGTRYAINTGTEASKGYLCWGTGRTTLDTSNDSYAMSFGNSTDPTAWNDFYLWTFEGSDPYAITIRSNMPTTRGFFLTPQNGVGGNGCHTWLVPDGTESNIIRTWALLTDNRLISAPVPNSDPVKVVRYANDGWNWQDPLSAINSSADILLSTPAYGYRIVNKSGDIALSSFVTPPASASEALAVPADLKSAHIASDSQYKYFLTQAAAYAYSSAATDEARTTAAAAAITTYADLGLQTDVYVGYYYDAASLPAGVPELFAQSTITTTATRYHVQIGTSPTRYWRATNKDNNNRPNFGTGGNELPAANYQWLFVSDNQDPYDIRIVTPYWPDYNLHGATDNLVDGSTSGAYSTGRGMFLNGANIASDNDVNRFFFTQSDIGIVVGAIAPQNKAGRQSYLYNYNNNYALLQRSTRGGDNRQLFAVNKLYCYHIVSKNTGEIAVSAYMPATSPLAVPMGIRTHLLTNSQYRFFTTKAAAVAYNANPTDEVAAAQGAITTAPTTTTELFLGYHYVNNPEVLDLTGERWYNMKAINTPKSESTKYIYTSTSNDTNIDTYSQTDKADTENFMWQLTGNDPYYVQIVSAKSGGQLYTQALLGTAESDGNNWQRDLYHYVESSHGSYTATSYDHFMLLEHMDKNYSLAMVRPRRDEATCNNRYIGQKEYLWTFGVKDASHTAMQNNHETFTYYSDRSNVNSYHTKVWFEEVKYTTTFHIIDNSGREAIKYTGEFPAKMPLDFAHIPADIRSPYLIDETLTFYSTATQNGTVHSDASQKKYDLTDVITQTSATAGGDVYVRYTTAHLLEKPFRLTGARNFNVRINGDHYIYTSGDDILTKDDPDASEKSSTTFYWNLFGGDPYAVKIRNAGNGKWIQYASTASDVDNLTFRADTLASCYFIAMRTTDHGYEMMAATGTDAATGNYYSIGHDATNTTAKLYRNDVYPHAADQLQMILSTNELRAMYHIIDYDHKIVIEAEDENVELQVPLSIQSPFVAQYHFYHINQFDVVGDTYTPLSSQTELANISSASTDDGGVYQIYVTYDKRDDVDLPSLTDIAAGGNIKKYRLKYFGGDNFYQEDGGDKVMTTQTKAIYPYANGEANFYVYGEERLNIQMSGAATTRNRWPWYFESEKHDPYHVKVCSASTTYNLRATKWSATPTSSDTLGTKREDGLRLYFRTYPVRYNGSSHIVTGAITKQSFVTSGASMSDASAVPTEYMVLGTSLSNCRLVTVGNVALDLNNDGDTDDEGESSERRTVTSFEQYWKNNPTVLEILYAAKGYTDGTSDAGKAARATYAAGLNGRDLDSDEKAAIAAKGWHVYEAWASINSWSSTSSKTYQYTHHAFQTINMGSDFEIEEMTIDPALILLDQHGWEIMRRPIPSSPTESQALKDEKYDAIRPYNSSMVKVYRFWHVGSKAPGYHKYTVSEPITVTSTDQQYTSTDLTQLPPYYDSDNLWEVNSSGVANKQRLMDQYVTYEVKEEYAASYTWDVTETNVKKGEFLVKQGETYAQTTDGNAITTTTVPATAIENNDASTITDNMLWYIAPNYNIDYEMGYKYEGELGAFEGAKNRADTDADYEASDVFGNGFDPYNLRLQSKAYDTKYFTTNATTASLDNTASMASTYSGAMTVTLTDATARIIGHGHDNTELNMSNATFMAVQDDNGNMRLMPRFDHHHVVTVFTSLSDQQAAAAANDQEGAQTTILLQPLSYEYIIVDNQGYESIRYQGSLGELTPQIPEHLQSPLAKDFVFYKDLTKEGGIYTEIPAGIDISAKQITSSFAAAGVTDATNTVYVRYSFNPDGDKYKILSEGDWHTVILNGKHMQVIYGTDGEGNETQTMQFGTLPDPATNAWQCKFIGNATSEQADPYNVSGYNRQKPTNRWNLHYALLQHGDDVALCSARRDYAAEAAIYGTTADKEKFKYYFLSNTKADGTGSDNGTEGDITDDPIIFYCEPGFTAKAGEFNDTKSQLQFGDVPMHQLTYYVITNEGKLALKAKEPVSRAQGEPSQPTAILPPWARSPLLNVEDYSYYMQATVNGDGTYTLDPDDRTTLLTGLPSDIVYVRYDYQQQSCPLKVKDTYFGEDVVPRYFPFDLTGNTCYNIVYYSWGSDFWYTQEKNWQGNIDDSPHVLDRPSKDNYEYKDGNFLFQGEKPYLWKMLGNDPYAITIKNAFKGNNKWLTASPYADNESLEPLLTDDTSADIQSFMLLKHNGMLILAATGHLNLAFNNGRWSSEYGSKWLRWHSEVDESLEDPLKNYSGHDMEFFKAPLKRNYTFHAMRFDNDNNLQGEQWSATLSRDMLSAILLENDITRLFAKYEQEYLSGSGTANTFKDHESLAEAAQFYSNAALTQRIYDEGTDTYDIYPEIGDDDTYDIYFKYKIDSDDADALAAIASSTADIEADIAQHNANGRLDQEHIRAKWWMMDLIDSREEPATEKFLRREDNGNIDWMDNGYAFHADKTENYNTWTYHRLAEWYREGDNDAFREGRWLWAFVGEDPYNMRLLNLETAVGVSAEGEGVYTLKAADNCWVTASTTETGEEDRTAYVYNVKLPAAEPSTNMTWGLCEGDGTDNTLTLQLPITTATEQKDALYWQLAQEKKKDVVVADSIAGKTEGSVIRLLRYVPVKYEDVNLVIRRDDEVAVYQAASAIDKPDVLASMTTGISKLYFAASDRTYEEGDKIDMTDPETLPLNVRRAFCNYKLYSDVFTTIGGIYTIKAGPYPTTTQKTTTGAWRKDDEGNFVKDASGNYIYDANGGDPVFDEDGKEVWVYTSNGLFDGTPYEDGAQSIYASYTVTTDMFLKSAPNKTEVEKMANNNDHVFFIDFPGDSDDDEAHHAYYDPDATFYDQTGDLKKRTDANTGQARSEKRVWDSTAHDFVDDKTLWYNHYQWRTANDRMVSVPERLKWYFVGDPYKLQVYCTAGPWNTSALKDKDGQEIKKSDGVTVKYPANTVAANLCRFDRSETNFEFVVDCVHLRLPDYSNIDTREKVSRTDEYGNPLEELHNRHYQQPYFDEFFWECVPAATDDPQAFALRFKEDNDLLGYRNVYYYLSHDGLSKTYLTDGKHESYKVNLNYRPNNERHQDGTYKGYHVANDESTVIKLVQPVKVYVSAFGNVATGNEKSENRKNTEGSMASTLASQRKTRDELSEYYGLGETLTAVPRHLQRKFVKYGTMNHLLSEANAASISDCKDVDPAHTVANSKVFVDGLKVNPVFRFNVSYSISDLSTDQAGNTVHLFTTPGSSTMQWLDVCIGGSNWLYYDKMNPNGSNPNTALVSNYRRAMSEERKGKDDSYNGWDDGLKGLHWAFVGDPYDFTIVNRRLSEDGSDNQWLVETKATIADYLGLPNDSVIWTTSLKPDSTMLPAATPATSQAIASTTTGATHFSTQMWKTGGDADYFLRTASLKSNADDFNNGSTTNTNQTNNYWRMVAMVHAEPESYFEMVPFSLADKNVYNDNIYNGMYSETMKGLGITQQLLEIRTAVAKDEDNADNDCFDADVEVRNANGERVAFRENMEIKYGDVVTSMPWTLRRYGCTYTCYIGYTTPASKGTQLTRYRETATDYDTSVEPDITASEAEAQYNALYNAITTAKAGGTRVKLTYIYDVEPNVKAFFTTEADTETEDYTWMNTYFGWNQSYSGSWQQVEHRESQFDHYVYNSAGQIIDEVYVEKVWYEWEQGKGGTVPTKAYLNTVGGQNAVYAQKSTQNDDEELKWSLVGDPYNFNMVNYAQYLNTIETGTPSTVYLSGNHLLTSNSMPAQSFAIAIDKSGNSFLAVIDEDGNILHAVDFEYSASSDKHLETVANLLIYNDDPTGNTLNTKNGSGTVKPFFLANLVQFADVVVYHLVMAHQHSLDAEDKESWSTGTTGTITDQKTGYDTGNNGSATGVYSRLLEFLKYWGKRNGDSESYYLSGNNVTAAQLQSDAEAGSATSFKDNLTGAAAVKTLLKEKGTLRNFLSYPVEDQESAKEGIGNHPQVPWTMKRQFCKYYLYQRDVMRSVTTGEQAKDSEGNLLWMDEAKTQPAYTIKWVSIFDQDYWSDWTDEDTENALTDEELANRKVEVSTGVFKKAPKFYQQALAGQGEIIDKLLQCHENRKVIVDVVYEVNPDRFRFADKGRNTTAWYSMMTNNTADGLMNFSYLDGIGARLDRTHHYTNNYLWAPEGDPYGFVLRSRYATINGTGWDDVAVTTKGKLPKGMANGTEKYIDGSGNVTDFANPSADDLLATYTSRATQSGGIPFNHKRIIHRRTGQDGATTDGATNAVYEMFEGSNSSSFLVHPTSAWIDVSDDTHPSYYLTHNTATNKTELTRGTASAMLTNSDANWRLEATAEQLIPYFQRAGYVGGMDPVKVQAFSNLELYNRLQEYVADPSLERSFTTLKRAQEIVYSGTFYKSNGTTVVQPDEARPTGNDLPMKFVPDNLVSMKPGYYRIKAFSEDALNTDGQDLAGDGSNIKGIIGPRYISGYRFESEKTDPDYEKNSGGRWLHFLETDMQHSTIHTYGDLLTKISQVDTRKGGTSDRDQISHPAMQGNIEILPADFDASSIFQFTKTTSATSGYEVYNLGTQGLQLWARPGTSEVDATTDSHEFGRTELVENTPSAAEGYGTEGIYWDNRFRLADIGGAAITLRTLKQETDNWDNDVSENLKTNYLCIDRNHRYRVTCHTDNEMVEIGDHYTTDGLNGIQDTKWLLQPVGTKEDWPYNQMPLRVEVHKGGRQARDLTKVDDNYYGSLYLPFHSRLGRPTDAAFTLTSNPTSGSVTMKAVSQINGMGNSQYVPATWPVVLQTSKPGVVELTNEGHTEESPNVYATRYYVNMYLPEGMQDVPLGDIKLQGQYLEQTLSTANNVMVFGLPYEDCSADGHTSTSTHTNHTPDVTKAVGWYTNHNWARESNPTFRTYGGYPSSATEAAEGQRSNRYVYHNKVYYEATASAREYVVALFDGDDEWDEDQPIDETVTGTDVPWPCDVYDLAGRRVARDETPATLRRNHPQLLPGVYVFGGRKVVVR